MTDSSDRPDWFGAAESEASDADRSVDPATDQRWFDGMEPMTTAPGAVEGGGERTGEADSGDRDDRGGKGAATDDTGAEAASGSGESDGQSAGAAAGAAGERANADADVGEREAETAPDDADDGPAAPERAPTTSGSDTSHEAATGGGDAPDRDAGSPSTTDSSSDAVEDMSDVGETDEPVVEEEGGIIAWIKSVLGLD